MNHDSAAADDRPASEIMADARILQARHASSLFGASARRLRGAFARLGGEPGKLDHRRLTAR